MRSTARTAVVAVASSFTTALVIAACAALGGASPGATGSAAASVVPASAASASVGPLTVAGAQAQVAPGAQNPAVQVYQNVGASVVNITSIAVVRTLLGPAQQPQGIGSGYILDTSGRIITNNHVVRDASQLTVTFQDQTTVPAKLVGRDPDNDLAVIQVDPSQTDDQGQPISSRLKPVSLGDSDQVTVGETTIAIGSPLGLAQSVTEGIVSALRNPGESSAVPQGQIDLLGGAIQTDASINPGNSGGPLLNASGLVIGVNSAILSQSGGNEGIGFAIPVNVVKRVVPELIQNGSYRHPLLGVSTIALSQIGQQAKQQLGLPTNQKGLLVQQVSAGAAQAGIQAGTNAVRVGQDQIVTGGDIVVAIDGRQASTGGDLRGYIENNKHPGDTVTVTVLRNGQRMDFTVTLTERPPQGS